MQRSLQGTEHATNGHSDHQVEGAATAAGQRYKCWGCGLEVQLAAPSPVFQCGWCGAVTKDSSSDHHRHRRRRSRWDSWALTRDYFMILLVIILISSIIGGGVTAVFPIVFRSGHGLAFSFHCAVTVLLSCQVFFNYFSAAFSPAGHVETVPFGSPDQVPQGSLYGHSYCDWCARPKPGGAHHCRSCGRCVMGMDHHCPFIGNCVGFDNQRSFLLFLVWAVISCVYAFGMCCWGLYVLLPSVLRVVRDQHPWEGFPGTMPDSFEVMQLLTRIRVNVSLRLAATAYLGLVSLAVVIGVSVLLHQQLRFLFTGHSFIDSLQAPVVQGGVVKGRVLNPSFASKIESLRKVFGVGHPVAWLLVPRLPARAQKRKSG